MLSKVFQIPSVLLVTMLSHLSSPLQAVVQSTFEGPVELKVWKHWQESWNVETPPSNNAKKFDLERGVELSGDAYVSLRYIGELKTPRATLQCKSLTRSGTWEVQPAVGKSYFTEYRVKRDNQYIFNFAKAEDCLDRLGERIVTEIAFEFLNGSTSVYQYTVKPMYVRGKNNAYWDNKIDPYSAHAGKGSISIAGALKGESGWDIWDGVLVKPLLNFVDRNTLSAMSTIGLHRHEANQELYFIESGEAKMTTGIARKKGDVYEVSRKWDVNEKEQNTSEFFAEGGWIEHRKLTTGELAVIVPNPQDRENVYFHGIEAKTDVVFWTMGTKN